MNRVVLVGRLTRDPELRTLPSGQPVASFSVAVNRPFKNREGVVEADFINTSIFGKQAENVSKYCFKGSQVGVEGRIQTRSYDAQDGTKRYVTEVIADHVEFLTSKKDSTSGGSYNYVDAPSEAPIDMPSEAPMDVPPTNQGIDVSNEDPFKDFGSEIALSDDDLPF